MIFSVVDGVLVQPLPFADPDRLVELNESHPPSGIRRGGLLIRQPARLARDAAA